MTHNLMLFKWECLLATPLKGAFIMHGRYFNTRFLLWLQTGQCYTYEVSTTQEMFPYVINASYKLFQTLTYSAALIIVLLCLFKCRDYNEEIYTKETDYVKWVTRVPAFTVCPAVNGRYIAKQLARFNRLASATPTNISFFGNLVRPKKVLCPGCPVVWIDGLPTKNVTVLAEMFTPICETQFSECSWNDISFPCCQYFQPLPTRRGLCYSLNSEQTSSYPVHHPMRLVTSHRSPKADLKISAHSPFTFHIHDRKAISFLRPRFHITKGKRAKILYKFTETVIKKSAKELLPTQRTCIFDDEIKFRYYRKYDLTVCKTHCLQRKQLELCGCRLHTVPGSGPPCDFDGLLCLDLHSKNLTMQNCGCKYACTGQVIKTVYASLERNDNQTAVVVASLTQPPTERDVYYAKTTILETLIGFVCLTRLVTTADLYDVILALWILFNNYMDALNFLKGKTMRLLKIKIE